MRTKILLPMMAVFAVAIIQLFAQNNPGSPNSQNTAGTADNQGVYVESYHMRYDWYYTGDDLDTYDRHDFETMDWDNGSGGTATDGGDGDGVEPSVIDLYSWPGNTWPQPMPDGTWLYWLYTSPTNGSYFSSTTGGPDLLQEHCNVSDAWIDGSQQRTADTKMTLATGGKPGSTKQNLWVISASATAFSELWVIFGEPVDPTQITVMGKSLGSDGKLYVSLPDNQTLDATPHVNGVDYYTFGVGAQKYTPYITANGANLDNETPEFCVGQQVMFALNGLPGFVDAVGRWSLPGKYVNEQYQYSSSCTSYRVDSALLDITGQNLATACWYVNQPGGTVGVNANLHFSNGQYASVAAMGNFTVYRPQMTSFVPYPPFIPMLTNGWVELGNDSGSVANSGVMHFDATVQSKAIFPGLINWVQLNYRHVDYVPSQSTTAYDLDNGVSSGGWQVNPIGTAPLLTIPESARTFGLASILPTSFRLIFGSNPMEIASGSRWELFGGDGRKMSAMELR